MMYLDPDPARIIVSATWFEQGSSSPLAVIKELITQEFVKFEQLFNVFKINDLTNIYEAEKRSESKLTLIA